LLECIAKDERSHAMTVDQRAHVTDWPEYRARMHVSSISEKLTLL